LPDSGRVVVTGGELQLQLDTAGAGEKEALLAFASDRIRPVLAWTRELGVPVLPLSTAEDVATQVGRALGAVARPRRGCRAGSASHPLAAPSARGPPGHRARAAPGLLSARPRLVSDRRPRD